MAGVGINDDRLFWLDVCDMCGGSGVDESEECPACCGYALIPNIEAIDLVDRLRTTVEGLRGEAVAQRKSMRRALDWLVAGNRAAAIRELARTLGQIITVSPHE